MRQITVVRRPRKSARTGPAVKLNPESTTTTDTCITKPNMAEPDLDDTFTIQSSPLASSSSRRYDTSVLDAIFQDRNKRLSQEIIALFGAKGRSFLVPTSPEAVNAGMLPPRPQSIRGVPIFLVQYAYVQRFLSGVPVVCDGTYFRGYYFPPWHFISLARKTAPAMIMTYGPGAEYNGAPEYARQAATIVQKQMLTKNPFSYAFGRKQTMQALRRALWTAITTNPAYSVDGTYFFAAKSLPTDAKALQAEMDGYVRACYKMAMNNRGLDWVDKFNKRINWRAVRAECARRLFPVPDHSVQKGHGLFWAVPKEINVNDKSK